MSRSFFEQSKKYLARLEKAAWKESRVGASSQHWDRLANGGSLRERDFPGVSSKYRDLSARHD